MPPTALLFLMRHGQAEPRGPAGDASRPLTARGFDEVARVAKGLSAEAQRPGRIVTSPYVRTHETARIIASSVLADTGSLAVEPALAAGAFPAQIMASVAAAGANEPLLCVGHMPDLTELLNYLVPGLAVAFDTAGVACVRFASRYGAGQGALQWYRSPGDWPAAAMP